MSGLPAGPEHQNELQNQIYKLRLYITGMTPNSRRAVENLKQICEEHLPGRYHLEVIDLFQQPELCAPEQIVAAPTLVKYEPAPLKKLVGDMSDTRKVLLGLGLI